MKSIVQAGENIPPKPFPKLMISVTGQTIVLAVRETDPGHFCGTEVGGGGATLGSQSGRFLASKFVEFEGSVTLSNE